MAERYEPQVASWYRTYSTVLANPIPIIAYRYSVAPLNRDWKPIGMRVPGLDVLIDFWMLAAGCWLWL